MVGGGLAAAVLAAGSGGDSDGDTSGSYVADTTAPRVQSFTSTADDGSYKVGDSITITATTDEEIQAGSTLSVTLDTGDRVELIAAFDGTSLSGSYTVGAGDTSGDLTVTSFTSGTVTDLSGNAMSDTGVPVGSNIADSCAIAVDGIAPEITNVSLWGKTSLGSIIF
jgi:hypothetical protein